MRTALLSALLMLGLAGCPCAKRRTYTAPTARALATALGGWGGQVRTLRAKAKVDQWTSKGRIKVRVFILTTSAGKLRFEAVSPFDTSLVTLVSDGQQFASIDHKNHIFYSGAAKPCNIARVFGLALDPKAVGLALSGGAPLIPHDKQSLKWDRCQGTEVLRVEDTKKKLVQRVWMLRVRGAWRVLRSTVSDAKGKILVELLFEKFRTVDGKVLPRVIKFRQAKPKADVIIRYHKQRVNVAIPAEAFQLRAPPGLPERILTCP
jgi:hypothetical protein